jgi:hypothetical protein
MRINVEIDAAQCVRLQLVHFVYIRRTAQLRLPLAFEMHVVKHASINQAENKYSAAAEETGGVRHN